MLNLFQITPPETATTDPTTSPGPSTSSGASKRSSASTSSAQPKKKKVKTENPSIKIKQDPDQVQGQDQDEQDQKPAAGKSFIFLSGNIDKLGVNRDARLHLLSLNFCYFEDCFFLVIEDWVLKLRVF